MVMEKLRKIMLLLGALGALAFAGYCICKAIEEITKEEIQKYEKYSMA